MNYLQQFKNMLAELDDSVEAKQSLVSAFGNVEIDFNQAIEKRNEVKESFNNYKSSIKGLIGADDVDKIREQIDTLKTSGNDDIEKVKADLQAKYEADTNELRTLVETEKSNYSTLKQQHEQILFNIEVEKQGLLEGFRTSNPRVKDILLSEIRNKLILEDGKFYVKDQAGEKARDIKTGEYLPAKSISDEMQSSKEWTDFVSPKTNGNGTAMPSNQNSTPTGKKPSEYTEQERVDLYRNNPTEFNRLFKQG